MKRTLLFSSFTLLLTACADSPQAERSAYTMASDGPTPEAQQHLSVQHLDLSIEVFPEEQTISGVSQLTLYSDIERDTVSVDLDREFDILQVSINGEVLPPSQYKNPYGELLVDLPSPMKGDITIAVSYAGSPRVAVRAPWDGGFVWSKTASGQDWIATAVQGEGCDLFWACIDRPEGEPQVTDLHITVPKPLVAASNGILKNVTEESDTSTYHWHSDIPQNTYGIALNIAPYQVIKQTHHSIYGNDIDVHYYHLPESADKAPALVEEMHDMLDFFERMVGPYPSAGDKVGLAETPHLGMEHQSINAYGNQYRKDEYGYDWLMQHEFAHEWFANQLTNQDADDMWLHEGFGAYMQPLYAQYLHGDMAYLSYLFKQRTSILNKRPLVSREEKAVEEVYSNDTGPGGDIYVKGSLVLHTLRQYLGDEIFFKAVTELVYGTDNPQPGHFEPVIRSSQDFIDITERVSGQELDWFFDVYLFQAELPNLVVQRSDTSLDLSWQTNGIAFPMPVDVSVNGSITTLDMTSTTSISVSPMDTVIVDPSSKLLKQEKRLLDFHQWKKEMEAKKDQSK